MNLRFCYCSFSLPKIPCAKDKKYDRISTYAHEPHTVQRPNINSHLQKDWNSKKCNHGSDICTNVHAAYQTLGIAHVEHTAKSPPEYQLNNKSKGQNKGKAKLIKHFNISHIAFSIFNEAS